MKNSILIILLLGWFVAQAQIPTINENNDFKKDKKVKLEKEKDKLQKEIKKIEAIDSIVRQKMAKPNNIKIKNENIKLEKQIVINDSLIKQKYDSIKDIESNLSFIAHITKSAKEDCIILFNLKVQAIKDDINNLLIDKRTASKNKDEEKADKVNNEITKKEKELEHLEDDQEIKLATLSGIYNWFLPTKNKLYRKQFFDVTYNNNEDHTNYLNGLSIVDDKNGTIIQSEIIADYFSIGRIAIGSVITASKTDGSSTPDPNAKTISQSDALNRLVSGGGNMYLEYIVPIMTTYDGKSTDLFTGYTYFKMKGAGDIKGFGSNVDTSSINGSAGLNFYGSASSESKNFNFFAQANFDLSVGSQNFYENLGLPNHNGFLNGKIIIGLTLINTFRLSAIVNTFGSNDVLRSEKVVFGIQFLPDLLKKSK